jgi:formylglycine-generating enzyme required for sulfatase activity
MPITSTAAPVTPMATDGMVLVPAGPFQMGNSLDNAMAECKKFRSDCETAWFLAEEPVHTVDVAAFYIDVYEVTNAAYRVCLTAGVCQDPHFVYSATHNDYFTNPAYNNHPMINVNWEKAKTYCEWRGARLPTEAEWEKAARGTDGRTYPWGNDLDTTRANYQDSKLGDPITVGSYESGKSPYGAYDMTGNVWEWTADWFDAYPGSTAQNPDFGQKVRVLRGGAWLDPGNTVHASYRGGLNPLHSFGNIGFRCARSE